MVCHGMVWYGMVWYGMVWYGMVWYGVYGSNTHGMVEVCEGSFTDVCTRVAYVAGLNEAAQPAGDVCAHNTPLDLSHAPIFHMG